MSVNSSFPIKQAREETPGCKHVIHFNNAGAALMPTPVINSVNEHLQNEVNMGGYEAAEFATRKIETTYQAIAKLISAQTNEIAILESATRAWDMIFYAMDFSPGDIILTSYSEYASNYLAFLQMKKRCGITIKVIPNDSHGQLSLSALEQQLSKQVKLIAITHVPTNSGLVNPVADVGKLANDAGIWYLLDACQSVGQLPLDVKQIGCDFLTATGRKYLRAPRGTGFLFCRHQLIEQIEPPFIDLRSAKWTTTNQYEFSHDAHRFECWESNIANKIGLGAAANYATKWGIDAIATRINHLASELRHQLNQHKAISLHDRGEQTCGIVSFTIKNQNMITIKHALQKQKINLSISSLAVAQLDMEQRKLNGVLRASVHYYNTNSEIEQFFSVLSDIIGH